MVYSVEKMLEEGMTPDQIAQEVLKHAKEVEAKAKEDKALIKCREVLAAALTDYAFKVARMEATDEEWGEMYDRMLLALEKEEKRINRFIELSEKFSSDNAADILAKFTKGL